MSDKNNPKTDESHAVAPNFDLTGVVEAAILQGDHSAAIRALVQGILINNRNIEDIAHGTNQVIGELDAIKDQLTGLAERVAVFVPIH